MKLIFSEINLVFSIICSIFVEDKNKNEKNMTKLILCDKDSAENNWDYKCPKLSSDDWDELADPCDGCSHRIFKRIEIG